MYLLERKSDAGGSGYSSSDIEDHDNEEDCCTSTDTTVSKNMCNVID